MDENVQVNIVASQTVTEQSAKRARTEARADLLAHLGKLINRADLSDLKFVCKNGVKVEACRIFFAGRSPVFDSMLTNGMRESTSSVISLPEIPAPALLAIMEFLYTGNIVEYRPSDWQMGLEILSAAHFFLLPTVDKIVDEFNMAQIPSASKDLQQAAIMLSEALTFKCLCHDENKAFLQLVNFLQSKWMHPDYACHLSEEALEFILKHTKPSLKNENGLDVSLDEYFRFRGVLIWCMYNTACISKEEVDKLINVGVPIAKEDLYDKGVKDLSSTEVVWLPKYRGDRARGEIMQILDLHGGFDFAIRLLTHIDWVRMPPILFVKVVEPMKLLSESRLLDIFRFHTLHRVVSMALTLKWAHNESYIVHNNGLLIQKNGRFLGSAICLLENRAGDHPCKWRFLVQKVNGYCQLGFVCSEGQEDPCQTWNFGGDCVSALKDSRTTVSRVIKWASHCTEVYFAGHGSNFRTCDGIYQDCNYLGDGKIEFEYCRTTRSCAVTLGDKKLGTVWTGLPAACVFPAVYLGDNPGASVSLEIVSGFEIF